MGWFAPSYLQEKMFVHCGASIEFFWNLIREKPIRGNQSVIAPTVEEPVEPIWIGRASDVIQVQRLDRAGEPLHQWAKRQT